MNAKERCNVPLEIPSEVTDRKFIRMPKTGKIVENDDEWSRSGKWKVIFLDDESQDTAWIELHSLIEDGTLLMVKASTAKMVEEGKVILCYTSPEKSKIKKAAIAIERRVSNNCFPFVYKTNETTERGFEFERCSKDIIYKFLYTPKGKFYEKDSLQRWTLVNDANIHKLNEVNRTPSMPRPQVRAFDPFLPNYARGGNASRPEENTSDYGILGESLTPKEKLGISLLSAYTAHEETFCLKQQDLRNSLPGYWAMKCDFTYKDEIGRTEMERVQEASKELFEQGVFPIIIRRKTTEKFSEFHFYIKQTEDQKEVLTYAIKLRNSIYYPHAIYFYMWDDVFRKHCLKYMHFADGEFFELVFARSKAWKAVTN